MDLLNQLGQPVAISGWVFLLLPLCVALALVSAWCAAITYTALAIGAGGTHRSSVALLISSLSSAAALSFFESAIVMCIATIVSFATLVYGLFYRQRDRGLFERIRQSDLQRRRGQFRAE